MLNIESFRDYCLSKPGTSDGLPFDESTLVLKVMNKIFAICGINSFEFINLKCDPNLAIELREQYPCVRPGFHMNKKHWNSVYVDGSVSDQQYLEWIDHSYDLIVSALPKKLKDELKQLTDESVESLSYLALGDSYTIGELVPSSDNWPHQLQSRLKKEKVVISKPKIIATTGWTTDELQAAIESENPSNTYDLVSLSIGVNNQYRGFPIEQYESEFESLLLQAIHFAKGDSKRVFVVSIPDYGVTPFAKDKKPVKIAQELTQYNQAAKGICNAHSVAFHDITPSSKAAEKDTSLLAEDGLHPSAKMYEIWVDLFYSTVYDQLK